MSSVNSDSPGSRVRSNRPDGFLLLLLIASLSLNVYLGWSIKQRGSVPQNTTTLLPGMTVDQVTAIGTDGNPLTILYNDTDKPTVFYVITPSCIWCKRNQANINKVAETKSNDFRFIGLSLAEPGLKEYIEEHHFKFPVYTGLTARTLQSLGLGSTPQTIVISPEGKVLKVWTGAYSESCSLRSRPTSGLNFLASGRQVSSPAL